MPGALREYYAELAMHQEFSVIILPVQSVYTFVDFIIGCPRTPSICQTACKPLTILHSCIKSVSPRGMDA